MSIEPVKKPAALKLGSAVHRALETAALALPDRRREDAFEAISLYDLDPLDAARARAMVLGYLDHHGGIPGETYAVELEIGGPIPDSPVMFAGRIDRVLVENNRLYILDYKTTSRYNEALIDDLENSLQGALYAEYLSRVASLPVGGVIYDIIEKPLLTPKKVTRYTETPEPDSKQMTRGKHKGLWKSTSRETMPEFEARLQDHYLDGDYIHRPTVIVTQEMRQAAMHQLTLAAQEVEWRIENNNWAENRGNCTGAFGWPCFYRSLCMSGLSPVVLENEYQRKAAS
jgi:hypothetical protein